MACKQENDLFICQHSQTGIRQILTQNFEYGLEYAFGYDDPSDVPPDPSALLTGWEEYVNLYSVTDEVTFQNLYTQGHGTSLQYILQLAMLHTGPTSQSQQAKDLMLPIVDALGTQHFHSSHDTFLTTLYGPGGSVSSYLSQSCNPDITLSDVDRSIADAQTRLQDLLTKLHTIQTMVKGVGDSLPTVQKQINNLSKDLTEKSASVEELVSQYEALNSTLEDQKTALQEYETEIADLESQERNLEQKLSTLNQQIESAAGLNSAPSLKLKQLLSSSEAVKGRLQALRDTIEKLQTEYIKTARKLADVAGGGEPETPSPPHNVWIVVAGGLIVLALFLAKRR